MSLVWIEERDVEIWEKKNEKKHRNKSGNRKRKEKSFSSREEEMDWTMMGRAIYWEGGVVEWSEKEK
jgi:hypothetical protein